MLQLRGLGGGETAEALVTLALKSLKFLEVLGQWGATGLGELGGQLSLLAGELVGEVVGRGLAVDRLLEPVELSAEVPLGGGNILWQAGRQIVAGLAGG